MYGFYISGVDLTKFTDVPEAKVESGYAYKYNSDTENRLGTLETVTVETSRATGVCNNERVSGVIR